VHDAGMEPRLAPRRVRRRRKLDEFFSRRAKERLQVRSTGDLSILSLSALSRNKLGLPLVLVSQM